MSTFITDRTVQRTTVTAWIFTLLAQLCAIASLVFSAINAHDRSKLACRLTPTDGINLGLSTTALLLHYSLLSTGPTRALRLFPFNKHLHLLLTAILAALGGALIARYQASCGEIRRACATSTVLTEKWDLKGKECLFVSEYSHERWVTRGVAELIKRASTSTPVVTIFDNTATEEKGRWIVAVAMTIFLALNFLWVLMQKSAEQKASEAQAAEEQRREEEKVEKDELTLQEQGLMVNEKGEVVEINEIRRGWKTMMRWFGRGEKVMAVGNLG